MSENIESLNKNTWKTRKEENFSLTDSHKKNWITCRRFEQMWKMIFRFSDWYWEIYIKWMEKAYKKNYHYELKIGIVWRKKKFIHSEFNNSKKEKCLIFLLFLSHLFHPFIYSFCLSSSRHHDDSNAPKCECVSLQIYILLIYMYVILIL